MSVLIKGMEKPKDCMDCPFRVFDRNRRENVCVIDRSIDLHLHDCLSGFGREIYYVADCPLIELPDHGDLIDRNMLIGGFADWYIQESPMYIGDNGVVAETIGDAMKAIEAAHVVIPAERSEECPRQENTTQ